jgi:peroxiredoxin
VNLSGGFALLYGSRVTHIMPAEGDSAPRFTATYGDSDHEPFDLEDVLGDGPVVLAFFPGAFTPPCRNEMVAFQEQIGEFEAAGASLYGISADSAFSLGAFADEYDLEFDLVSDMGGAAIGAYDLTIDIGELGLHDIASRVRPRRGGDHHVRLGGRRPHERTGLRGGPRGGEGGLRRDRHPFGDGWRTGGRRSALFSAARPY